MAKSLWAWGKVPVFKTAREKRHMRRVADWLVRKRQFLRDNTGATEADFLADNPKPVLRPLPAANPQQTRKSITDDNTLTGLP